MKPFLRETERFIHAGNEAVEVRWRRSARGNPSSIRVGGRTFRIADTMPIAVEVRRCEKGPTFSDRFPGPRVRALAAGPVRWRTECTETAVRVTAGGSIEWKRGKARDRVRWYVTWSFEGKNPGIGVALHLRTTGSWRGRVIRSLAWQLPLGLDHRKRVAQGGEYGIDWDTRYYYNFLVGARGVLMPHPEVNVWRHFAVEQETPHSFRIWRAESDRTAPLIMQRGETAPGWTAVYDRHGGFKLSCSDLSARAPRTLRVDARGGGKLQLQLHPPTAPAADPRTPEFQRRALGEHRLRLLPFAGEWNPPGNRKGQGVQEAAVALAGHDPACKWIEETEDAHAPLLPVTGGVPFARGEFGSDSGLRVFHGRRELPIQWEPLAFWPDGSVKWALLIFPLRPDSIRAAGHGAGRKLTVDVTLRDGRRLPIRIEHGKEVRPAAARSPVQASAEKSGGTVVLENGKLCMRLVAGRQWLQTLRRNGRELLGSSSEPEALVDYLALEAGHRPLETHARGRRIAGPLDISDVRIEESGPLRAVARLEGKTAGRLPVNVILRVEMYAGCEWVRIWKTVEFLDADPRQHMVCAMGLSVPLALSKAHTRILTEDGGWTNGANSASVFQFSPGGYTVRLSSARYGMRETSEGRFSQGWLSIGDDQVGATVIQRYFREQAPRENRAECRPAPRLTACFHPDAAPVMDVRRYSEFPHRGQMETVPDDNNHWVYTGRGKGRKGYYEADPFKGVSRTFETLWGFHDPEPDSGKTIRKVAADFHSRPLIDCGEQRYRTTGVTLPWGDVKKFRPIALNENRKADFWLFNQRFWNWWGWNHGDTVHGHHSGLGAIVPREELRRILALPQRKRSRPNVAHVAVSDMYPDNQWAFDNGRWGWTQTERLPALFWQMLYLRTGRRDVFFQAESISAYSRDVVVRHHGLWFGAGTRHGVQPWSCGDHEERQTVHLEWRIHYFLTGDKRSADVNRRLTEAWYLRRSTGNAADLSGRLPGLLMHWERTGDPRSRQALERCLRSMVVPQGLLIPQRLNIRTGDVKSGEINSMTPFFHTFGGMHALLEYWYLTDDLELKASLKRAVIRMARQCLRRGETDTFPAAFAVGFAAAHAAEPRPFLEALETFPNGRHLFHSVTANPAHWTGPTAYRHGSSNATWEASGMIPYLTHAWERNGRSPRPTPRQRADFRALEQQGVPREIPRLAWQAEFDHPDFDAYFARWRPWSASFSHPASDSGG